MSFFSKLDPRFSIHPKFVLSPFSYRRVRQFLDFFVPYLFTDTFLEGFPEENGDMREGSSN